MKLCDVVFGKRFDTLMCKVLCRVCTARQGDSQCLNVFVCVIGNVCMSLCEYVHVHVYMRNMGAKNNNQHKILTQAKMYIITRHILSLGFIYIAAEYRSYMWAWTWNHINLWPPSIQPVVCKPGMKRKRRRREKKLSNLLLELPFFARPMLPSFSSVVIWANNRKMFSIINRQKVWGKRDTKQKVRKRKSETYPNNRQFDNLIFNRDTYRLGRVDYDGTQTLSNIYVPK